MNKNTTTLEQNYNLEKIDFLRENKSKITEEILVDLRSYGIAGKQIALDILELKDKEELSDIHIKEINKCADDVIYFKDNYVLILNKDKLQDNMINFIKRNAISKINTDRNTKKTYAACIYALHQFLFSTEKNIGISSFSLVNARNILSNISTLYNKLPSWMKGKDRINKTYIESQNKVRIMCDAVNEDSYLGWSLDILIVDAVNKIKEKTLDEFFNNVRPRLSSIKNSKIILLDTLYKVENEVLFDALKDYSEPKKVIKPEIKSNSFKEIIKKIINVLFGFIKR